MKPKGKGKAKAAVAPKKASKRQPPVKAEPVESPAVKSESEAKTGSVPGPSQTSMRVPDKAEGAGKLGKAFKKSKKGRSAKAKARARATGKDKNQGKQPGNAPRSKAAAWQPCLVCLKKPQAGGLLGTG